MALAPTAFVSKKSLKELQDHYAEKLPKLFTSFVQSSKFKFILNQLELNDIQFTIADISQAQEIINLMEISYSSHNPLHILFATSRTHDRFLPRLKQSISMNRCFIGIDNSTNEIVSCTVYDDFFDTVDIFDVPTTDNDHDLPSNYKHLLEVISAAKSRWIHVIKNSSDYVQKYGKYIVGGSTAIKASHQRRFLNFMNMLYSVFLAEICGYQFIVSEATNKRQIDTIKKITRNFVAELNFEFADHKFKDGSKIDKYFDALEQRNPQIDVQKFKDKSCVIVVFVAKLDQFDQKIMEKFMKMAQMIRYSKIAKKSKLLNKKPSKL